jgi:hypothetical protein
MAPAISGTAILLAIALVAHFRPDTAPLALDEETPPVQPIPVANEPAAVPALEETVAGPPPADVRVGAGAMPRIDAAPLPGGTATTPMADLLTGRGTDLPPSQLIEGERAFAAEAVDRTWAAGAEASIYAKLAEIPGLELIDLQAECRSTMCRLQMASGSSLPSFKGVFEPIGLEPAWMAMTKDRTGQARSFAYLWRDGFGPPKPELGQPHEAK